MQNQENLTIRFADPGDAEALLEIYRPYVEKTAVSFETAVPSVEEFRGRIRRILEHYPYLAAEKDGALLGYAYAGPFVGRAAYRWSAEVTIYLREDQKKKGIGRMLYARLEELLKARHITNLYACIGIPVEEEDEYLTRNSMEFHAHMGYRLAGKFYKCGYKFGRWYSMVWMEKILSSHKEHPEEGISCLF